MKRIGHSTEGFTLLEVVMASLIFTMVALGISGNLMLNRRIAETTIRESTAYTAASGYIEQVKSIAYEQILMSVRNPAIPLPTVLSKGHPDPLEIGKWVEKQVVIDIDSATSVEKTMPLWVRLDIEDLESPENGTILGLTLQFSWEDPRSGKRHSRALRTMRSYVMTM